jgi:RNA polymerase-interacting CarD/CdnL/TRCF family regulator
MDESREYSKGDWIVHARYGVGQIKGIEEKCISGEGKRYCRIQASNSTFWMPVDQMDSEVLRPLSTLEEFREDMAVLHKPPKEMSSNYKARQSRIRQVWTRNSPKAIARLIRDLRARRRKKKGLNGTERKAFDVLKQRLIEEWAILVGVETNVVSSGLNDLLSAHLPSDSDKANKTASRKRTLTGSALPNNKQNKWWLWQSPPVS